MRVRYQLIHSPSISVQRVTNVLTLLIFGGCQSWMVLAESSYLQRVLSIFVDCVINTHLQHSALLATRHYCLQQHNSAASLAM